MADVDKIGVIPVLSKELLKVGLFHGDCFTVTGHTATGHTVTDNLSTVPPLGELQKFSNFSTWLSMCMAKASFMGINIILYGPYSYMYLLMAIKDIEVVVALTYSYRQHITTKLSKM